MKKLATASAFAMLGLVSVSSQAAETAGTPDPVTESIPGVFSPTVTGADSIGTNSGLVSSLLQRFAPGNLVTVGGTGTADFTGGILDSLTGTGSTVTTGPDISVISGAINMARINGAIDISGTNVGIGMQQLTSSASAKAESVGTGATSEAFAIAGAKLATTVIGAMNSATVEVAGRTSEATSTLKNDFGVDKLAGMTGGESLGIGAVNGNLPTAGSLSNTTASLGGATLFSAGDGTGSMANLEGLTNNVSSTLTAKVSDLQNIGVFNAAINVAALDAGIKVAAVTDPNAWFLNPQTGLVNLNNISMATTAIGAMNSSITKLGTTLAK